MTIAVQITPFQLNKKHAPYSLTEVGWGTRLDGPGIPDSTNGLVYPKFSDAVDAIRLVHSVYLAGIESTRAK